METGTHVFTDLTQSRVNRALHFALELTVWIALGVWGWQQGGYVGWPLALGLPLLVIVSWTAFAVPSDPWLPGGPQGDQPWVPVPGWIRLAYELAVHGLAAWALISMGSTPLAIAVGAGFVLHYAVSYQRVLWLIAR